MLNNSLSYKAFYRWWFVYVNGSALSQRPGLLWCRGFILKLCLFVFHHSFNLIKNFFLRLYLFVLLLVQSFLLLTTISCDWLAGSIILLLWTICEAGNVSIVLSTSLEGRRILWSQIFHFLRKMVEFLFLFIDHSQAFRRSQALVRGVCASFCWWSHWTGAFIGWHRLTWRLWVHRLFQDVW